MITSFSNPKVKFIRKLEQKKYRQESELYFIEGLRTVGEAVQTGAPIDTIVVAPDLLVSDFGLDILKDPCLKQVDRMDVSREIYEKIAHKDGPQGIGAVVRQCWQPLKDTAIHPDDLWIALDSIADPGNLGTIMRTADAVSASGLILLGNTTDPYDPTSVKASMGAIFSLRLVKSDWATFHTWKVANQLRMIGTSDRVERDYQATTYPLPMVLLMGSEREGLSTEMIDACDQMVRIPMAGRSDSLNLSIATAVMLYEIYNQSRNRERTRS